MVKKRVHELAKELGLENREAVVALQAAGMAVKTHSSSVYQEEALLVLQKIARSAPPVESPSAAPRRPGMMIVKKRRTADADNAAGDTENAADTAGAFAAAGTPAAAPPLSSTASQAPVPTAYVTREHHRHHVYRRPTVATEPANNSTPDAAAASAEPTPSLSDAASHEAAALPSMAPELDATLPLSDTAAAPLASAPTPSASEALQEPAAALTPETPTSPGVALPPMRQPLQEVVPPSKTEQRQALDAARSKGGAVKNHLSRPGAAPATVVRMIDRDKLLERVPGRRLGQHQANGVGRGAEPRGAAGGERKPAGANAERGAAGQRFGQVTELKVVTDPFGRGREMVPLGGREKKKGVTPAGGALPTNNRLAPGRRGRSGGKRDMNDMRERSLYPSRLKKKKTGKRQPGKQQLTQPKASKRIIKMKEAIVVADLAHQLGVKAVDIIRKLMALGVMVTQNQSIDFDTTVLLAQEFEYTVESVAFTEDTHLGESASAADDSDWPSRPPVVTVMGHVDHGKTSLLDAIRKARVASGEAGGITQHIGAYQVTVGERGTVTFLDTPGHAAFTSMRARGAQVTDIVVLVVAADDGLMPQTEEAIKHAQAAKVPIIVAINKIDRPEANPERVMQELAKFELVPEAWGGDTLFVNTSATKGTGIQALLDAILLQAEVLELKANPERAAVGVVIEAQLDKGRGPVATVLISQGTLRRGDAIVVGSCVGKLRAMADDQGRQLKSAGPAAAVEITGLDNVPEAGDTLHAAETPEAARQVAEHRTQQKRLQEQASASATSLDDLMKRMEDVGNLELKVVLKADVQGSVEAIKGALLKLSTDEVKVNVIYGGVGGIKESDIMLAAASGGLVLGFGVRPDSKARAVAERAGVEVRTYTIIYEAVDDISRAMEGLLKPEAREKVVGRAEVRELFKVSKVGLIAGCRVLEGKAQRAARVRVLRDSVQIFDGKVASLRHFKNDAREVETGAECGVGVEAFNDIKIADVIEFYQIEEFARTLGSPMAAAPKRSQSSGGAAAHP